MKNKLRIISVVIVSLLLTLTFSCKKEVPKVIPSISTSTPNNITASIAISGGTISSDGGAPVTSRGVCWGLNQSPTTSDNKTYDGAGIGSFTSTITGLNPGIIYYVRAYATNSIGTAYGSQIALTALAIIPSLTTNAITNISGTSATSGGSITSDGGATILSRGVCWSANQNPTIANSKTVETSGQNTFTSSIIGLTYSTTYYVRAYATNSAGTGYGNEIYFTTFHGGINFNTNLTYGSVTDINGNIYKTIKIVNQTWMAENLKTTKYRNGDLIGTTTPATLNITAESTPKYQWAHKGDESNVVTYGRLYTWHAAIDSRNVCPTGWHLPTNEEWNTLKYYLGDQFDLGDENVAADKLKETGITHWRSPNSSATNASGFTALPSGERNVDGTFNGVIENSAQWWSSNTDIFGSGGSLWNIRHDRKSVYNYSANMKSGYSVRCLKDN